MSAASLSVIVITLNEARDLADCLASVRPLAQQIVVVDAGSSDGTVEIAQAAGAQVHRTADWPGFGPQKNRALALAEGRWVLSLDADERLTAAARDEIAAALAAADAADASGTPAGFELPRLSQFCGRWVRHSGWHPDYVLRLFRRDAARFSDDLVHERVIVDGPLRRLCEPLLHYSYVDRTEVEEKIARYAEAGAQQLHRRGRRCGPLKGPCAGAWAWLRTWLLRGGWRDGAAGWGIAAMNARATARKYRRLRELHRSA